MRTLFERTCVASVCGALLTWSSACSRPDQQRTNEKAAQAREEVRDAAHRAGEDARKLGREAKAEASTLGRNIDRAMNSSGATSTGTSGAEEKLRRGEQDLRAAGEQAGVKLDRAAMIAKVKSKLAADVGLSTVAAIDVDASGGIVTLTGSVSSEEQKNQAAQTAKQVDGVARVLNRLTVKP